MIVTSLVEVRIEILIKPEPVLPEDVTSLVEVRIEIVSGALMDGRQ